MVFSVWTCLEQRGSTQQHHDIVQTAVESHKYNMDKKGRKNYNEEKEYCLVTKPKHRNLASRLEEIPCMGILLAIASMTLLQVGSVIAKKQHVSPFMMLFIRDLLQVSFTTPFLIKANETPFPKGRRTLIILRGIAGCVLLAGNYYAIRHLPIADVTMICSIKPVFITLMSCIFLKEACGTVEIINLGLVISGIFLVVQPSLVFGETDQQYTVHMLYTAIGLLVANMFGSVISIILRYLRNMHWAALAMSTRIFGIVSMFTLCSLLGVFCIPQCGFERFGILLLAVVCCVSQVCTIMALKIEEAHIIGISSSVASIVVSVIFQILFFGDHPNHLKILGICLVLLSIIILGGNKIWKKRNKLSKS